MKKKKFHLTTTTTRHSHTRIIRSRVYVCESLFNTFFPQKHESFLLTFYPDIQNNNTKFFNTTIIRRKKKIIIYLQTPTDLKRFSTQYIDYRFHIHQYLSTKISVLLNIIEPATSLNLSIYIMLLFIHIC